jgi:putative ABC transport system permease protein
VFKNFPLIVKNCWRNRRRTTLTILSIAASLCLLGILMAVYQAFYLSEGAPEQALRLITRNKVGLAAVMPQAYEQKIKAVPGVHEVMIANWYGGTYIDSKPEHQFARFSVEGDKLFTIRPEMKLTDDEKAAFLHDRRGCVIGKELADKLALKDGDRMTLVGDIYPGNLELTIRGIYNAPIDNDVLYFDKAYIEEGLPDRRKGNVGIFYVLANSADDVPHIEKAVDDMFANSPQETKTETESAFALSFVAFLGNVKGFLMIVSAAVTFTILLVSANTIAMSVRERIREIGVLKVLGFTNGMMLGIILGEAIVISAAGGLIGVLLANFLAAGLRHGPDYMEQLHTLQISPAVAFLCVAVAAFIGLVSAYIPALQASRIPILSALKSTD